MVLQLAVCRPTIFLFLLCIAETIANDSCHTSTEPLSAAAAAAAHSGMRADGTCCFLLEETYSGNLLMLPDGLKNTGLLMA